MQMRPEVQIKSIIKALADVVLPAVDPNNKLAQEQTQLAMGLLTLMSKQLPLQFRFDCDELERLLGLSEKLAAQAIGGAKTQAAVDELNSQAQAASAVLQAARSGPEQIHEMVRALRSATGELVTQTYCDGTPESRMAISCGVLETSKEQLLRDRSWLLMQGWETDPESVPAIEQLLSEKVS